MKDSARELKLIFGRINVSSAPEIIYICSYRAVAAGFGVVRNEKLFGGIRLTALRNLLVTDGKITIYE